MSAAAGQFDGPLTRDTLEALLAQMCRNVGLNPRGAELIKFTNNAVFRLQYDAVVVRIAGSAVARSRIEKVVAVARWLAEHDLPAVRLLPNTEQPLAVGRHSATLWRAVPAVGSPPTVRDLAEILLRWHGLPSPCDALPAWSPFEEIRQRLAEAEAIDAATLTYLTDECNRVESAVVDLRYVLPAGPIHGDAYLGNMIPGAAGPVICDFDSTSHGPREWDLIPVAVGQRRFDYGGDLQAPLAAAYGFDVTDWDGFPVLRRVRELKLVTSVLPILNSNPTIRAQWSHRMETYRRDDLCAKWTPYR